MKRGKKTKELRIEGDGKFRKISKVTNGVSVLMFSNLLTHA